MANYTNTVSCDTSGSTSGWDGRVYGVVLVAALQQDNAPKISYEVADGNVCLNYQTPLNTFALTFPGSFTPGDDTQPDLTTVYLAGNEGVANSLYLNNKLLSAEAANGGGQDLNGDQWADKYLDVDHWDVSGNLASQDNQVSFDRGDATYLHPVLVVLRTVANSGAQAAGQGQTAGQGQVAGQSQDAFNDIQNHWARAVIDQLAKEGIVSGFSDQGFHPDALISRAQFAALLVKALALTPAAGVTPTFGDVPASYWGYQVVETAAAYGLISGSNGSFYPDQPVTRQEMTVMLVKAVGLENDVQQLTAADVDSLLDVSDKTQISSWAAPYVAIALKNGLVKGMGGAFNPMQPATRAEAAVMIANLLNYQK
jgi:hypothetical protein